MGDFGRFRPSIYLTRLYTKIPVTDINIPMKFKGATGLWSVIKEIRITDTRLAALLTE